MRQWTLRERQRQAELIRGWQPWKHSTGAITPEGKAASKMNAMKDGAYSTETKNMQRIMSNFKSLMEEFVKS